MNNESIILISGLVLAGVFLILQPWFWVALFVVLSIASFLAMLASIFHFQIIAATGFFFLGLFLWWIMTGIYQVNYEHR